MLNIISQKCKQLKCPLTSEWIKKLVPLYDGILFDNKKEGLTDTHNNMDKNQMHYAK